MQVSEWVLDAFSLVAHLRLLSPQNSHSIWIGTLICGLLPIRQ
jgi:hypothetical protein